MRIGPSHQAGSDSLLTAATFFKMREQFFQDKLDEEEFSGVLYGLGGTYANGEAGRPGATLAERDRFVPSVLQPLTSPYPTNALGHGHIQSMGVPTFASSRPPISMGADR